MRPERVPEGFGAVEVDAVLAQEERAYLGAGARLAAERADGVVQAVAEIGRVGSKPRRFADGGAEPRVVGERHEMDRPAHEHGADDPVREQCALERLSPEALDARPEADVRCRSPLRLQAGDALDRRHDPEPAPLQEELPRERRAVQLAERQYAHCRNSTNRPSCTTANCAGCDMTAPGFT